MRTVTVAAMLVTLLAPATARAQADSARRSVDSLPADSATADSARPAAAPRKATPPTPATEPAARPLGPGECPPASARNGGDAMRRFASPQARGPVKLATPVLRDPSLRGRTTLAFEVDTLGRVDSTTVRIVEGDPYLLPTARSSVARWRFRPAELLPGCRIRARTTETVTF
jgi:outer membrane biosynthesis protein TonB